MFLERGKKKISCVKLAESLFPRFIFLLKFIFQKWINKKSSVFETAWKNFSQNDKNVLSYFISLNYLGKKFPQQKKTF